MREVQPPLSMARSMARSMALGMALSMALRMALRMAPDRVSSDAGSDPPPRQRIGELLHSMENAKFVLLLLEDDAHNLAVCRPALIPAHPS